MESAAVTDSNMGKHQLYGAEPASSMWRRRQSALRGKSGSMETIARDGYCQILPPNFQ
jgi:hypothetical protein